MRAKARKGLLFGLLGIVGIFVVAAGFGYWRLSQGPVTIGFLSGPLENIINASLSDMRIRVRDAVIERDPETNTVHLRLREAQLEDLDGQLIARAPRAAVELSGSALLSGEFEPESLEFIGPRILVRRTIDGGLQLGFGETTPGGEVAVPEETNLELRGGQDQNLGETGEQTAREAPGSILEAVFRRVAEIADRPTTASSLQSISITDAAVSIYDEVNDAIWYAPKTSLVLRRVPYGISLLAHGQVASGKTPWTVQLAAQYVSDTQHFNSTVKVEDFIPADIADEIFVLSDLAQVDVPLTGQVELEFDGTGKMLRAEGTFTAGAGHVGFPRYISQSLLIDEGEFNLSFIPETGELVLEDSALHVGGSRATITGGVSPVRDERGRMVSLRYELLAQNVSLDTEGTLRDQLSIDRFELRGLAALEEGRLDVDNLSLRAGAASIQMRGTFLEGPDVPAVFLRGRMEDIPAHILMKLWPPDAAPGAREWIVEHVEGGTVAEANLSVNLTSQALAGALQAQPIPQDQLHVSFRLQDVRTRYFRDLPPLQNARGSGTLRGNDFEVLLDSAQVQLDNGQTINVGNGRFFVDDLAAVGSPGVLSGQFAADASAILRLIDHDPLSYASAAGISPDSLGGQANVQIELHLPLLEEIAFDQVEITTKAELSDVQLASVFNGVDVQGGNVVLDVDKQGLTGNGRVVLNGVSANVQWNESFVADAGSSRSISAAATLSEKDRRQLNIDLSSFLRGSLPVRVTAVERGGTMGHLHFEADLSKAEVFLDEINWRRAAGQGAKASFDLVINDGGGFRVANLDIEGPDHLSVKGEVTVADDGRIAVINLPLLALGPGNRVALAGQRSAQGGLDLRIAGDSFDARPVLGSFFGDDEEDGGSGGGSGGDGARPAVTLQGQIKTVFLNNHEHLSNVDFALLSANGAIQQMRLSGLFADSRPLDLTITPSSTGERVLGVTSGNAGALFRAVDLYSRVQGGQLKVEAILGAPGSGEIRNGRLRVRQFDVVNEPALASLSGSVQRQNQSGTTASSPISVTRFDRLNMSFIVNEHQFQIVDEVVLHGPTIGATARGTIGRGNGALNLAGTLTPAYALNAALGNVPILGQALLGGQGQGLIGVTFAVTGSFDQPRVTINPVSALAPGFLKRIFEFGNAPTQRGADLPALPTERRSRRPQALER